MFMRDITRLECAMSSAMQPPQPWMSMMPMRRDSLLGKIKPFETTAARSLRLISGEAMFAC